MPGLIEYFSREFPMATRNRGEMGSDRPAGTTRTIFRILVGAFLILAVGFAFFAIRSPGLITDPTTTTSNDRQVDKDMTLKQPGN